MQRVLVVLADPALTDVRLKTLQINSLGILSRFELSVPIEGDQGPTVKDKLAVLHIGASREVKWDGKHIRTANTERRDWNMAGQFVDAPKTSTKPPVPAVKPAGEPKPPASPMLDNGPGAEPSAPPAFDNPAPDAPAPDATPAPANPASANPSTPPSPTEPKTDPKPDPATSPATSPAAPPVEPKKKEARP